MKRRGQVWIETVLYTLIGLSLIGLVLAFALPKITESKDRLLIEQAITSLNDLDDKINAVSIVPGNKRFVFFTMKRGELFVDSTNDQLVYSVSDLSKPYSEPGSVVRQGRIEILSQEGQKESSTDLTLTYTGFDLVHNSIDEDKKFSPASTPYKFAIENIGDTNLDGVVEISIKEVSA